MWSWSTVPARTLTYGSWSGFLGFLLKDPGPKLPSLTCRCCRCACPGTGSGRACTRVGCRTRCNGAGPAASAGSRPPDCARAGEGGGTERARPGSPFRWRPHPLSKLRWPRVRPHPAFLNISPCPCPLVVTSLWGIHPWTRGRTSGGGGVRGRLGGCTAQPGTPCRS